MIVTGDRSIWTQFTKAALTTAVNQATAAGSFPFCTTISSTNEGGGLTNSLTAVFMSSSGNFYLTPYAVPCPPVAFSFHLPLLRDLNQSKKFRL